MMVTMAALQVFIVRFFFQGARKGSTPFQNLFFHFRSFFSSFLSSFAFRSDLLRGSL